MKGERRGSQLFLCSYADVGEGRWFSRIGRLWGPRSLGWGAAEAWLAPCEHTPPPPPHAIAVPNLVTVGQALYVGVQKI